MTTHIETFTIHTKKRLEFITVTEKIQSIINTSGIQNGMVLVQTHHTTCSVWVNEDEKNLVGNHHFEEYDLKRVLDRFAHPDEQYGHNDIKDARNPEGKRDTHLCKPDEKGICHECINGHAHAHAMILPHAVQLIVQGGKLLLGTWQEIMAIELDHDRERTISVLVMGEK